MTDDNPYPEKVRLKHLLDLLGIKKQWALQLAREGVIVKADKHGYYELVPSVQNYLQRLRDSRSQKVSTVTDERGNVINLDFERGRKLRAEAEALERKNKIETGELLPLEEVQADIKNSVSVCAKIFGSLKMQIAKIAPEVPHGALELVEKEQAKMLTAMIKLDESYAAKSVDDPDCQQPR